MAPRPAPPTYVPVATNRLREKGSYAALAAALGCHTSTVASWLQGRATPSQAARVAIADRFDVAPELWGIYELPVRIDQAERQARERAAKCRLKNRYAADPIDGPLPEGVQIVQVEGGYTVIVPRDGQAPLVYKRPGGTREDAVRSARLALHGQRIGVLQA